MNGRQLLLVAVETANLLHCAGRRPGDGPQRPQRGSRERRVLQAHDLPAEISRLPERVREANHPPHRPRQNVEHRDASQPRARDRPLHDRVGEDTPLELVGVDEQGGQQRLEGPDAEAIEDASTDPGELDPTGAQITDRVLFAQSVAAPPLVPQHDADGSV